MDKKVSAFGGFGNEITFEDFRDLYHKVHSIVPELQLEVLERETSHRESYTVLHYVLHECSALRLPLPLTLIYNHPGSPDFRLLADGKELGIEITEATTGERQKALKEMAKERERGPVERIEPSINSGLVGSQIEEAEKEAREKWTQIVAERINDKILKAAKYDYKHPLRLIVYSNTGYDFEDTEEAIKLLKQRLTTTAPFENVSILLGGKYLVGDVLGNHYHHVCYSEFDEMENAIDYLERTADFLEERGPVHAWKWVWISLYEAIYSFLICALKGTNPDNVLQPIQCPNGGCGKWSMPGDIQDNGFKCPKCAADMSGIFEENLIAFKLALERSQDPSWMCRYTISEVLTLDDKDKKALKKLSYIGNGLLNLVPKSWAIQVPGRDELILRVADIVEKIALPKHNIFLNDLQEKRLKLVIKRIRDNLSKPFSKDYIP
jgi:tetratricopeptide (TPR) repeat protein